MKNLMLQFFKRLSAFSMAVIMTLSSSLTVVPQVTAQGAPGALNFSFNTPGSFPAQPVSFTINNDDNGGAQVAAGSNIFANNSFPSGNFTVNVTNMPAGFVIANGTNYMTNNSTSAQFTLAPGGNQNITFNIAQTQGVLNFNFNTPGTFPAQPVAFTLTNNNGGAQVGMGNNAFANNAFPAGTFTMTVTNMPAGFIVGNGTDYTSNNDATATFTIQAGSTNNLTFNIVQNSAVLNLNFNTPGSFPAQPVAFTVNDNNNGAAQVAAGNNTLANNAFPAGDFTINVTNMPTGFTIAAGNGYTVASATSATFTSTAGANLNLGVNIAVNSSTVNFSFSTPANFPAQPVAFSINDNNNAGAQVAAGNNTFANNVFPTGDFTINVTNMPANFIIIPGNGYTVASDTSATFTSTAGGNLNFTVAIASNSGSLNISFNTPGTFPAQPVAFSITDNNNGAAQVAAGNNTLANNAFPIGDFTITLSNLPAGFNIGANAGYTVTSSNTATFSLTQGQTLNLGVNILDGSAGTGALQFSFNPATQTVPFTITGQNTGTTAAGTNTFNNNALPADTYLIAVGLPGAQVIQPGPGFTAGGKNVTVVLNAGDNLNLTFNIVGLSSGGGRRRRNKRPNFFVTNDNKGGSPMGDSPAQLQVKVNEAVSLTLEANDMNRDDELKLEFTNNGSKASNKALFTEHSPHQMINIKRGTFTWTPNTADLGENVFTFKASDNFEATEEYTFVITVVEEGNLHQPTITFSDKNGPVMNPIKIKKGSMNLDIDVRAVDQDESALIKLVLLKDPAASNNKAMFSLKNPPITDFSSPRGFNPANGRFQWIVSDAATSSEPYKFVFQASSGQDTVMVTLNVFVMEDGTTVITPPGSTPPTTVQPPQGNQPSTGGGGGGGVNQRIPFPDEIEDNEELTDDQKQALRDKMTACQYRDNKTESVIMLCVLGVIDGPNVSRDFGGSNKNNRYFGRDKITRAAFTKMMVNITYQPSKIQRVARLILDNNVFAFPDVEPIAWFAQFIAIAKMNNQVHGYSSGNFVPWNDIERSEAFKILINTAAGDNSKIKEDLELAKNDNENGPWFAPFDQVVNMYGGFTTPKSVDPGLTLSKQMSRQEAADVIYTTIRNAGIDAKSQLARLKQTLVQLDSL